MLHLEHEARSFRTFVAAFGLPSEAPREGGSQIPSKPVRAAENNFHPAPGIVTHQG
jgi:hypothetical protein